MVVIGICYSRVLDARFASHRDPADILFDLREKFRADKVLFSFRIQFYRVASASVNTCAEIIISNISFGVTKIFLCCITCI
jgi:hypothetical protein